MDAGKLIYNRLIQDSTLAGYVGTRIFPVFVPQDTQFPAVTYAFDNQLPSNTKDGPSTVDVLDLNITIYHENYAQAQAIAERIRTLLDYYAATGEGVTVDKISFNNASDNSYISDYEFIVLAQAYNVRIIR